MSKKLLRSMLFMLAIAATTIVPAMGQTTLAGTGTLAGSANAYTLTPAAADCQLTPVPKPTVRLANGTEDAEHWDIAPAEATTTGVTPGNTVTATYSGARKIKTVKAVKAETPQP